jgi:hypothetical protein
LLSRTCLRLLCSCWPLHSMHWVEGSLNLSLFFLFYVCCFLCLLIARAEALVLEGSMFVFFWGRIAVLRSAGIAPVLFILQRHGGCRRRSLRHVLLTSQPLRHRQRWELCFSRNFRFVIPSPNFLPDSAAVGLWPILEHLLLPSISIVSDYEFCEMVVHRRWL